MRPLDGYIKTQLDQHLNEIGELLRSDVLAILSAIRPGLDLLVRESIERLKDRKRQMVVILDTNGGIVEVVERMVETIRHFYDEVTVIVPDRAMSAGTIFALSADRIMMDFFSCLGPIDPQIERDGRLVPALAYLNQFQRLNEKAEAGNLTTAEYALLNKLDLGELYQFEQARELSIELLNKWLSSYKFKNWRRTETRQIEVTDEMRREQARAIADALNNTERWHSHGRGINMHTLTHELGLKIDDYSQVPELKKSIQEYFDLLRDYMLREQLPSFVHTREHF